jgi:hypothetical protein
VFFVTGAGMFICGCWLVGVNGSHGQMIDRERAPYSGIRLSARRDRAGIGKFQRTMWIGLTRMAAPKI